MLDTETREAACQQLAVAAAQIAMCINNQPPKSIFVDAAAAETNSSVSEQQQQTQTGSTRRGVLFPGDAKHDIPRASGTKKFNGLTNGQ